jgi:hypothetical protein
LNRVFAVVVSGLIGGVFGYFVGVSIGCDWLYPSSNLCGIYGMLITGPIGLISRRRHRLANITADRAIGRGL